MAQGGVEWRRMAPAYTAGMFTKIAPGGNYLFSWRTRRSRTQPWMSIITLIADNMQATKIKQDCTEICVLDILDIFTNKSEFLLWYPWKTHKYPRGLYISRAVRIR